jgi:hypothetical protein
VISKVSIRNFEEGHVDQSLRRNYFLGAGVVIIFLALNVWVAIDHFQIQSQITGQTVSALEGAKQIAEQRSALLAARPDNGPIDLQMMRKAGIRVPNSFVHGDLFASPWGSSQIMKQFDRLVWDFYEITTTGCAQLLEDGGAIAGVVRVAASSRAADEKSVPLTREAAAQECRRTPLMARLIFN